MKTVIEPNQLPTAPPSTAPRELTDVLKDLNDNAAEAISMLQQTPAHGSTVHPDHAKICLLETAIADLRVALRLAN